MIRANHIIKKDISNRVEVKNVQTINEENKVR